jgi:sugar (pentulose or hexulose) kinase
MRPRGIPSDRIGHDGAMRRWDGWGFDAVDAHLGSAGRAFVEQQVGWASAPAFATHLYRAIAEGLAYALREGAERTTKRTGVPIRELRVSGGGSQRPAAIQLTADIFGLPTSRPHTHETSGLGAAMDAAVGLGLHPSFEAAVGAMTRIAETREPSPIAHAVYEDLYRERLPAAVRAPAAAVRGDPADHGYPPEA